MKVWLIEDDGFKRDKIRTALLDLFPVVDISEARSAKSAFNLLAEGPPDLVLLDMSLPTFDIGRFETGGRPQGFGGVEVLREMDRRGVTAPVVVITQYEVFGEEKMGLAELARQLMLDHAGTFKGIVYYEAATEQWKSRFREVTLRALNMEVGGNK